MPKYKSAVEQIAHLDPELVDAVTSALAMQAADKFREAVGWMTGYGDPRVNVAARAAAMGALLGYFSQKQAAELAGCHPHAISRMKTQLLQKLDLQQSYNQPIQRKPREND